MPHVVVKLWPGKSEQQKTAARRGDHEQRDEGIELQRGVCLGCDGRSQSEGLGQEGLQPDIESRWTSVYKKPGYAPSDLE